MKPSRQPPALAALRLASLDLTNLAERKASAGDLAGTGGVVRGAHLPRGMKHKFNRRKLW